MKEAVKDIWGFLMARKKWWLFPIVAVLVLLMGLIVATTNPVVSSFIYPLF
jgi:uncharacterized membrane protein HdeD (DUF308 family)